MQPISREQLTAALSLGYSMGQADGIAETFNSEHPAEPSLPIVGRERALEIITEALNIKDDTNKLIINDNILLN